MGVEIYCVRYWLFNIYLCAFTSLLWKHLLIAIVYAPLLNYLHSYGNLPLISNWQNIWTNGQTIEGHRSSPNLQWYRTSVWRSCLKDFTLFMLYQALVLQVNKKTKKNTIIQHIWRMLAKYQMDVYRRYTVVKKYFQTKANKRFIKLSVFFVGIIDDIFRCIISMQ